MPLFSEHSAGDITQTLAKLKTSLDVGLSQKQISLLQKTFGPNQIAAEQIKWWQILGRQFKSSFIYLLLAAAGITFVLKEYTDSIMIVVFVLLDVFLGFYQEYRSEQTLKLLKSYVVPQAKVRRDGTEQVVSSKDLVPGDIVLVQTGDVIPADLRFLKEDNLQINESVLTGESIAVKKISAALSEPASEYYQATNIGFSGTQVVDGKGEGVVMATGKNMAIGAIAQLTVETKRESSFEKSLRHFSNFILRLILITLLFVLIAHGFIKGAKTNAMELVLFSIALAVSVIPEALPVVTTFSLSLGAKHLAKKNVVVKRLSAIEDLGSIEVLCTDKTGTITENKLSVADILSSEASHSSLCTQGEPAWPVGRVRRGLEAHRDPTLTLPLVKGRELTPFYATLGGSYFSQDQKQLNNAFDIALWNYLKPEEQKSVNDFKRIQEIPFDPDRRRNSVIVEKDGERLMIARGAAEMIEPFCDKKMTGTKDWIKEQGFKGRRVMAVAYKKIATKSEYTIKDEEQDLIFLGLISFVDPLKSTSKEAISKAKQLGVQVKILTGDGPEVAGSVAHEVGLAESHEHVITGQELEALSEAEQHKAVEKWHVFARVSPAQKYKIIELLKANHEVGFLGEGINDAPALKVANVGLVVQDASDIAREAADIILLKASLGVIVDGIQEGREVFANTVKYIKSTLCSNFGNFYAVAIASLLIDFLPMLPIQILLVNLLSDFPMIAVATDTVDSQELRRPKSYNIKEIALLATFLGLVSTVFDFIYFALFYKISPGVLQTNWFIGSIITELLFLFSIRTRLFFLKARCPSGTVLILTSVAFVLTLLIPFTNFGQTTFQFVKPTGQYMGWILGIALVYFAVTESVKLMYYRWTERG